MGRSRQYQDEQPAQGAGQRAYDQGRADQESRHVQHPFLLLMGISLGGFGAVVLVTALVSGSFTAAGAIADRHLGLAGAQAATVLPEDGNFVVRR